MGKRVTIQHDLDFDGVTIKGAIAQLQAVFLKVPDEFKDTVMIEQDVYENYGSASLDTMVYYVRKDTKEEIEEALMTQKHNKARRILSLEKELERLKFDKENNPC